LRPLLDGHARAMVKLPIELVDPLEKPAQGAGVGLLVVAGALVKQAMTIASQRENCCPQRSIVRVEEVFGVALIPSFDRCSPGAGSGIGTGRPLTL
jgi:hypothetical protein